MKTLIGKVKSVEFDVQVKSQAGKPYSAWSLQFRNQDGKVEEIVKPMQGLKYSPNLRVQLEALEPGDDITIEMEKNDKDFWEVVSVSKGGEMPTSTKAEPRQCYKTDRSEAENGRQTSIVRQSSLKAAVDWANGQGHATPEEIIEVAEKFETWVNR